ncbi:MAG: hypothetical protein IJU18_01505 [Oscillospiraceae bacterium]|nr:hypothetical protein [Oscillospiraceae bacterium]
MKLAELSGGYRTGEELIAVRMRLLRARLRQTDDPLEAESLRRRLRDLQPLHRECRVLAELTSRYYERGYRRHEKYSI